ncbi:MAG TPA: hypothetical protein VK781_12355, partial [Solirubrobacteraceae bacterium]|nr:hypothetical protein [Solirubrobacteraceae bacterium]
MSTLLALAFLPAVAGAEEEAEPVTFPGSPLTTSVGPLGQCESSYPNSGNNFFPEDSHLGDCGFFLAFPKAGSGQPTSLQGQTFGFSGFAGPRLENFYEPVSQSPVTGSGSTTDPYTQTTVFKVETEGTEDAVITETTTYVNGQPQFTSTYDVKNVTAGK